MCRTLPGDHGTPTYLARTFASGAGVLPIALFSVIRDGSGLHFHLINLQTGHRVHMVTQDAETDKEVANRIW
jgi:non-homologous end joining protein Ku